MIAGLSGLVRHRWVVVDGLRLHHLDYGGSDDGGSSPGPPLVLLHGATGHAAVWDHVATGLRGMARPIALDLRGFGDSQWSAGQAYRTTDHAADVVAVVEALELGPVVLVGVSWGALVALAAAVSRPDLVSRLVLVDSEPSFTVGETERLPVRPASYADHAEAVAVERAANPHAPVGLLELVVAAGTRPGPDGRLVPRHDPYFRQRWPFRSDDWWPALAAVAAPTLVVIQLP